MKTVAIPIPGTSKGHHLLDNLGAEDVKFSPEEMQQFNRELNRIHIVGLRLPESILQFSEAK